MAATIKDIAQKTGLGLATISSYLNGGKVREPNRVLIEQAIKELHYEVNETARNMRTNKTRTVGMIVPDLTNEFYAGIVSETETVLRNHGYATIICDCRNDLKLEAEAAEFLSRKRVDAVIDIPIESDGSHLHLFKDGNVPILLIDREIKDLNCDCVLVDDAAAAKNAVNSLMKMGHTRIGILCGPEDVYTASERLKGFRAAYSETSHRLKEDWIAHCGYTIEESAQAMGQLMRKCPELTAVFVANYELTVGAILGVNELGLRIPKQLSIIGFDNTEFAKAVTPKLSIVKRPVKEIAEKAAETILNRLGGDKETPQTWYLQATTIDGESVRECSF